MIKLFDHRQVDADLLKRGQVIVAVLFCLQSLGLRLRRGRNRGFIVEGVDGPAMGQGPDQERKLRLHLVLPDLHWQPAS